MNTELTLSEVKTVTKILSEVYNELLVNEGRDNSVTVGEHTLKLSAEETRALNNAIHKMQI